MKIVWWWCFFFCEEEVRLFVKSEEEIGRVRKLRNLKGLNWLYIGRNDLWIVLKVLNYVVMCFFFRSFIVSYEEVKIIIIDKYSMIIVILILFIYLCLKRIVSL